MTENLLRQLARAYLDGEDCLHAICDGLEELGYPATADHVKRNRCLFGKECETWHILQGHRTATTLEMWERRCKEWPLV